MEYISLIQVKCVLLKFESGRLMGTFNYSSLILLQVHLNGTKSKEELFNDVYGQIQNKIEELLKMQVQFHAYNCNSEATYLFKHV